MISAKAVNFFLGLAIVISFVFSPFLQTSARADGSSIHLVEIGRYDATGAEISAYDATTKRLFITGAGANVEVLDLSDPSQPTLFKTLFFDATSVAIKNGIVAIAVPDPLDRTNNGHVYLYDSASSLDNPMIIEVGALPDMLIFTPDGRRILVANEGERGDSSDPEGSVSIIDVGGGMDKAKEKRVTFQRFNGLRSQLLDEGVRLFPDAASVAQDLEPEYIAVSPDGKIAWITLQENNSIAVLQIPAATIQNIIPLGYKDHNVSGNGLDASDRDGTINIANWPVFGIYMPDGISAFEANGQTYLITANEGDARIGEEARVKDLTLDPSAFPNRAILRTDPNLGRLNVTNINGDVDGDGDFDELYSHRLNSCLMIL